MLEKRHHVFNIGSTVTVKCSKVETKNISWHNGSTGVKIKSGGRIELNGLSLKIYSWMMQEHMSAEENQVVSSTPYMLMVSFLCAPFVRHHSIVFITTTIMQSFFDIKCCFSEILKYILYYYIILTNNLIMLMMSNGNRTEWTIIQGVIRREIGNYEHAYP